MFEREPNIDIVFRNGLKNLEVLPPADVWDNIPPMPVRRRRAAMIPAIAAGVAVLLSLTFLVTWYLRHNNSPLLLSEVALQGDESVAVRLDIPAAAPLIRSAGPSALQPSPASRSVASDHSSGPAGRRAAGAATPAASLSGLRPGSPALTASDDAVISPPSAVTPAAPAGQVSLPAADNPSALLAEADLPERADEITAPVRIASDDITVIVARRFTGSDESIRATLPREFTVRSGPRITLGASLSPTMGFSRAGDNLRLTELINSETARPSYSAGLTVGYRLSPRLTIQSGVGMASIGQTITDVRVYAGLARHYAVKSSYLYSVETASGLLLANNTDLYLTDSRNRVETRIPAGMADPSKYQLDQVGSDIQQVFRYVELPMMLRYKVIDRKVGLNLSGGVAYGFLVDNAAYTGHGSDMVYVGETEGVSPFNLSSQIGLGMEYSFSQKMTFSLEPLFRYYITPLSDISGSLYKPYSVGFYSGFFFKF